MKTLARVKLAKIAYSMSAFFVYISGPGWTPCRVSAASMIAAAALPGMPRVSSGIIAVPVVAFFDASGAASPSSTPVPNSARRRLTWRSMPYATSAPTAAPAPGMIPITLPMPVPREIEPRRRQMSRSPSTLIRPFSFGWKS